MKTANTPSRMRQPAVPAAKERREPAISPDLAAFLPAALEVEALQRPGRARTVLYLMAAFCIAALAWACLAEVDTIVAAQGKLTSHQQHLVVQPFETSVVKKIHVVLGQRVEKGQVLATLDPTFAEAGFDEQAKRRASFQAQLWRLECETGRGCPEPSSLEPAELALQRAVMHGREREFASRSESLERTSRELVARLATNKTLAEQVGKQITIARSVEAMYHEVYEKGASSRLEYLKAESARIESETSLRKLVSEATELAQALERAKAEHRAFVTGWKAQAMKDLADTRRELDQLEERERRSARLRELVELKAPMDGVVLEIGRWSEGSVAEGAQPLVTLAPLHSDLEAEVEIASADIGFIREGDPARIKLEAFPFQRHGILEGTVRTVSADSFENGPNGERRFSYRTRIALKDDIPLRAVPAGFHLLAGMTLTAEIRVGSRRVITFLTYPVIRSVDEAFREQ